MDDGRIAVVKCVYIQHLVTLLAWYSTHSTHSTCPRDRDLVASPVFLKIRYTKARRSGSLLPSRPLCPPPTRSSRGLSLSARKAVGCSAGRSLSFSGAAVIGGSEFSTYQPGWRPRRASATQPALPIRPSALLDGRQACLISARGVAYGLLT